MSKGAYLAKTAGGTQPQNFGSNVVIGGGTGQSGGAGGMTFGEMAGSQAAGTANFPGGFTAQDAQDAQDAQQLSNYENQINQQFQDKVQKEKEEADRLKLLQELEAGIPKTGIFGLDQNKLKLPSFPSFLSMGAAALEGMNSTNKFFKNLIEKGPKGLDSKDKIILANLIKAGALEGDIDFEKYTTEDVNFEQLKDSFETAAGDLAKGVTIDGKTVSYEDLIDQYEDGKPGGVGDLFGLLDVRKEGITLEKLKDTLGSEGLAYLQANNPALYFNTFGVPATLAGTEMDNLASMSLQDLTNSPEDKKLAQMIVEAREKIAENRQGGQGNAGQGIVAAFPSQPIDIINPKRPLPTVPDPTQPKLPITPQTPFAPFDINAFYASLPQYTQQGIMNPNLMSYYRNLGLFPGMAV